MSDSIESYPCPLLQGEVELTVERSAHIHTHHPELPANRADLIATTLADPDEIRTDRRFSGTYLVSRWFDDLLGGKMLVVVVVSETTAPRRWIVTAYPARRLMKGDTLWQRPS